MIRRFGKSEFDVDNLICYLAAVHNIGIFIKLCSYAADALIIDNRRRGQLIEHVVSRLFLGIACLVSVIV